MKLQFLYLFEALLTKKTGKWILSSYFLSRSNEHKNKYQDLEMQAKTILGGCTLNATSLIAHHEQLWLILSIQITDQQTFRPVFYLKAFYRPVITCDIISFRIRFCSILYVFGVHCH